MVTSVQPLPAQGTGRSRRRRDVGGRKFFYHSTVNIVLYRQLIQFRKTAFQFLGKVIASEIVFAPPLPRPALFKAL